LNSHNTQSHKAFICKDLRRDPALLATTQWQINPGHFWDLGRKNQTAEFQQRRGSE
jgi:hypothetical protein